MPAILAWIDVVSPQKFVACFTSADGAFRPPASCVFPSEEHARAWVLYEAAQLGVAENQVRWLSTPPAAPPIMLIEAP